MTRTIVEKHPESISATKDPILEGLILKIRPTAYADIDSSLILRVAAVAKIHLVWMLMTGEIYLHQLILGVMEKTFHKISGYNDAIPYYL